MLPQWLNFIDLDKAKKLKFAYESALSILDTHLQIRIDNYEKINDYKIVEHYVTRLKKSKSIFNKLKDKKCDFSVETIEEKVKDVVGIRIVCPFIDDVYKIKDLIKSSDFIEVYEEKDYIKNSKKTGYQSLHLLVKVPVRMGNKIKNVKAEIQVRTVAMDAWAAVEHRMKYKPTGNKKIDKEDMSKLIDCSTALRGLEQYMEQYFDKENKQIENSDFIQNEEPINLDMSELRVLDFENRAALKVLKAHLKESVEYFELINGTKKVEHYNERVKTLDSALRKLKEKGFSLTTESLKENVRDYAGVRLVCPFIDDVYDIVGLIKSSDLIDVYEVKDYIKKPKESGYKGVHLLVKVPVPVNNEIKMVKSEIQVRTLSMDAWSAIEERVKYLAKNNNLTPKQIRQLKVCADAFQEIDEYYNGLNHENKSDTKEKEKTKKLEKK